MARYDCKDCGAAMGIAYGYCDECTPPEVLRLKKELEAARAEAARRFDRTVDAQKWAYADAQTAGLRARYEAEYEKHKPRRT